MKNWNLLMAAILLLIATVFVAQSALAEGSTGMTNASLIASSNNTELVSFVESAVAYVQKNGKDKALKEFNNKIGPFVRGDLYIYAYDFNGTCLAHPFKPDWIGTDKLNLTDPNGILIIRDLINVAKEGGFNYFIFPNPAHDNKDELKLGYVKKVDDNWWLGSGTYLSNMSANFSQESRNNLPSFVESAVKYAKENGKDKALKAFDDKNGTFFKKGLYVFALDFAGNYLAHPTRPELIGKNGINVEDSNGVKFNQNMIDLAKSEGGFTYYIYPDPARNMTPGLKLSYVSKVDDTWWLGAGIYSS
jgi:polar amino acid transport system substrate-binding protein